MIYGYPVILLAAVAVAGWLYWDISRSGAPEWTAPAVLFIGGVTAGVLALWGIVHWLVS